MAMIIIQFILVLSSFLIEFCLGASKPTLKPTLRPTLRPTVELSEAPSTLYPTYSPSSAPIPLYSPTISPTAKDRSSGVAAGLIIGILLIMSIALLLLAFVKEGKDLAIAAAKKSNKGFSELEEEPEANDKF